MWDGIDECGMILINSKKYPLFSHDIVAVIVNMTVYNSQTEGKNNTGIKKLKALCCDEKEPGSESNYIQKLCSSNCTLAFRAGTVVRPIPMTAAV